MEEETKYYHGMEFFVFSILIIEDPFGKNRPLKKFTRFLDSREPVEVQLREASCYFRGWPIEFLFDGQGQTYLHNGWEHFSRAHCMEVSCLLYFMYKGDGMLCVKVFDNTMCPRHYHDSEESDNDNDDVQKPLV
jgi:hypothetical protein